MSRRVVMPKLRKPFVVVPAVYQIVTGHFLGCRLKDVCVVARRLAADNKLDFKITPEELVRRFAALIRPNFPTSVPVDKKNPEGERGPLQSPKIFRYSKDGIGLSGTEVEPRKKGESWHSAFKLNIEVPYPSTIFVPYQWAEDVFEAIRKGAVSATGYSDDCVIGLRSDKEDFEIVTLRRPAE